MFDNHRAGFLPHHHRSAARNVTPVETYAQDIFVPFDQLHSETCVIVLAAVVAPGSIEQLTFVILK